MKAASSRQPDGPFNALELPQCPQCPQGLRQRWDIAGTAAIACGSLDFKDMLFKMPGPVMGTTPLPLYAALPHAKVKCLESMKSQCKGGRNRVPGKFLV